MTLKTLIARLFGAVATALLATPLSIAAQGYPDKPVELVVPFAAGSVTDTIARVYAERVAEDLGKPIVVSNKPGASGMIGAQTVARAKSDGYTLLFGTNSTNAANMSLFKSLPYNQQTAFEPVAYVGGLPSVVVVNNSVPVSTLSELIVYAKANPDQLMYGAASSSQRVASEMLSDAYGIGMTYIPYKAGTDAVLGLINGDIQVFTGDIGITLSHISSGKIRALAATSKSRTELAPEIPTIAEAMGDNGFVITAWFGVFAPTGTPEPVVQRLNQAFNRVAESSDATARLSSVGLQPAALSPEDTKRFVEEETRKWAEAIKQAGIEPQ